ncbi:ABC transporter permease [Rhodopirellula sp. JC740]|uniref:ABC transporter permease n=1 Tax=Rhodopirellula halodulae TaxID=2894198 RepID=A0ABS8NJA0_9BACT|nr:MULTISPECIES: ABC transporter permease [unclassified Rhodopirellula]MCC9643643.1 ABC transporter permease [Rhodopirellula sp. JC740]MCC9656796.1 ABC transporter permease [Rhodopirellula sp. JC737]
MSTATLSEPNANAKEPTTDWLSRLDHWAEKLGDTFNPILIKETRQALKSRQFVVTFSVLLVAAFAWTVVGSLMLMPQIYTSPSAPRLLLGYYFVLAVPMLLIVPLAAYRSLEAEIDDGTLELLSITSLSPWQIVLGKLASASLQMMLYLITLFPCVAYAYTLRGIDLPTVGLIMAMLTASGLLLTVVALSFAPLARGRTGRISTLLVVLMVLMLAEYIVGAGAVGLILYGNPMDAGWTAFAFIGSLLAATCISHLLLTTTAAQLTPESENRSSGIRWSLLILTATLIALCTFAMEWRFSVDSEEGIFLWFPVTLLLAGLWTAAGSMMAAESSALTPRIQRELPGNFLSRLTLTFFTPGPATGLVFASLGSILITGILLVVVERAEVATGSTMPTSARQMLWHLVLAYTSYLLVFLFCVRWIVALVRINNNPRVEIGMAALIVVAVLSALIPYSIGLHMNDYRQYDYSAWQITNWAWTIAMITENQVSDLLIGCLSACGLIAFLLSIATVGQRSLAIKTATPEAVLAAKEAAKR